jgi:CRP-like cAMP-binding protein
MIDLTDLKGIPPEHSVATSRGDVRLYGLDVGKLERLARQYPEVLTIFTGVQPERTQVSELTASAVTSLIAAALSRADVPQEEAEANVRGAGFVADDEIRIIQEAISVSFPGGFGNFTRAALGLIKSLVGEMGAIKSKAPAKPKVPHAVLTREQAL